MKTCNSEYSYEVVKRCRFMYLLKSGEPRCKCTKNCAMCSIGGTSFDPNEERTSQKVTIWMHPDLHEKYVAEQARGIRGNKPPNKFRRRQERKEAQKIMSGVKKRIKELSEELNDGIQL